MIKFTDVNVLQSLNLKMASASTRRFRVDQAEGVGPRHFKNTPRILDPV